MIKNEYFPAGKSESSWQDLPNMNQMLKKIVNLLKITTVSLSSDKISNMKEKIHQNLVNTMI